MPYCDACDRNWTPTSMRPDGTCPTCGQPLERRRLPVAPAGTGTSGAAGAAGAADADAEVGPKAPWHFKVLLLALIVYLAWRGVQGIDWLLDRL